jgi:hypothetical protein
MEVVTEAGATVAARHRHTIVGDVMSALVLAHTLLVSIFFNQEENFHKPRVYGVFIVEAFLLSKYVKEQTSSYLPCKHVIVT